MFGQDQIQSGITYPMLCISIVSGGFLMTHLGAMSVDSSSRSTIALLEI